VELIILLQGTLNPGKGTLAAPYDSTQGVGAGFYWFALFFLLFILLGVLKAFWDDPAWRVRIIKQPEKKGKKQKR
jgi:hypothetical protein